MCTIESYLVRPDTTIREAIAFIDRNGKGIVLVVDGESTASRAAISSGHICRAILKGINLDLPVQNILEERKKTGGHAVPYTAVLIEDRNLPDFRFVHQVQ